MMEMHPVCRNEKPRTDHIRVAWRCVMLNPLEEPHLRSATTNDPSLALHEWTFHCSTGKLSSLKSAYSFFHFDGQIVVLKMWDFVCTAQLMS